MNKLLTIIVPVYKVEDYINKCLDSIIIAPELIEKLEVLVINDGTPDNSAVMAKEYEKKYPGIFRVIDKENGGHGSAWNLGLKMAKGKYLRFLDSDDWLTNLEMLIHKLETTDADIVVTPISIFYANNNKSIVCGSFKNTDGKEMSIDNRLFDAGISNFWYSTYKASLLKPFHPLFLEKVSYDDTILCIVPHLFAKSFVTYDFVVYNYLQGREGQSVDLKIVKKKINDHFANYRYLVSFVEKTKGEEFDDFVNAVLADYRRKLFNIASIIPIFKESQSCMQQVEELGNLDGIGCRDYKLYKIMPYNVFYCFERVKYRIKTIIKKLVYQ